jgi:hypothetical protein
MHSQGNILAYAAFFIWIPVALWIARRWPPAKAATLLFLVPLMFLPERVVFKLPGLPEFDKNRITIFWLLIALLLVHRRRIAALRLGKWIKVAIAAMLVSGALTMFLNSDAIFTPVLYLAPHRPYDAVHSMLINLLDYVLPFALAAAMFAGAKDLRVFFRVLVGATLVYSLFQIVELRLSPQFHYWVYGFYQHRFGQTVRGGGYRPMVFMTHGLALAMFTLAGVLAAAGLYKAKSKAFLLPAGWAMAYLWVILLLSKSIAAFLYSLVAVPLILFATPKIQFRVAAALTLIVLLYPDLRAAGLVPVDDIKEWVATEYGEEKVSSVMTRFINEEMLLERANERSFFGWGTYCRGCIHDPKTGETTSVTDGDWINTWGKFGRIGFYAKYILLLLPVFISGRRLKYVRRMSDRRLLGTLAVIVGFSVFNLIPNSEFNYLVFVFSGALLGCTEGILRQQDRQAALARQAKAARASTVDLTQAPAMLSSCSGSR